MFLIVIAAYAGGVTALVALWSYGWLIALAAAPFAGSAAAAAVFLLLLCVHQKNTSAPPSSISVDPAPVH